MTADLGVKYLEYKPLLFSLAYRMLGTVSDAEDMVQDCFVTLNSSVNLEEVQNEKAYFCKMVTNRCLDYLKSARRKREVYVGQWLPEPWLQPVSQDPEQRSLLEETVSYAFLIMIDRLTPLERAVFILKECFEYDYKEIASMLGRTEAACRKVFSRVKTKVQQEPPAALPSLEQTELIVKRFMQAAATGDMKTLIELLTEDIVLISDGGGKVSAAIHPIEGRQRVLAFLFGLIAKNAANSDLRLIAVNGQMGILITEESGIQTLVSYRLDAELRLNQMYLLRNPEKLQHVSSGR